MSSETKATLHLFNPGLARIYGVEAAVIYQHIRWVCSRRGSYQVTKAQLMEIFPYLSRKQIISALSRLLNSRKSFEAALLVRVDQHTTPTYVLRTKPHAPKLHSFDPEVASAMGLPAAIIYDDMLRWIVKNDEGCEGDREPTHYESPTQWSVSHSYLPLRTVQRAFKTLRDHGYLISRDRTKARIPIWTIPLGQGRMDRWKELHRCERKEKVNKNKHRVIYVPVLADENFASENGAFSHRQKGTTSRQKGTTLRHKGTTSRHKGTTLVIQPYGPHNDLGTI